MNIKKAGTHLMKHFNMIHMLLFVLSTYIIIKTNDIYNFLTVYLKDLSFNYNPSIIQDYFNPRFIFSVGLLISIISTIAIFLKIKNNNWMPYLLIIINNGLLIIALALGYYIMSIIEYDVPAINLILFIRGFYFVIIAFLYYALFYFGFIASGLSKLFDFQQELTRRTRKDMLTIKIIKKNKVLFGLVALVISMWIVLAIVLGYNLSLRNYVINNVVNIGSMQLTTHEAYLNAIDMKGQPISKDKQKYLVVIFDLKNSSEVITSLDVNKMSLKLNNKVYQVRKSDYPYFYDYGTGFNNQGVSNAQGKYFYLVFLVDNLKTKNEAYLRYEKVKTNKIKTYYEANINIIEEKNTNQPLKVRLKENLYLAGSPLKNTMITIDEFSINKQFKQSINLCVNASNCPSQTEMILPSDSQNHILMLKMKTKFDNNVNEDAFSSSADLLSNLAKLSYLDDKNKKHLINIQIIEAYQGNNNVYLEVPANVKKSIQIEFKIRNRLFTYILSD